MKILVVDDEEGARELFHTILTDEGYEVCLASSGEEALALFKANPFHRVVTDIKMPVMDGLTALRNLAALDPGAKVVMVTSLGGVGDKYAEAIKLGARSVISKPFEAENVLKVLRSLG